MALSAKQLVLILFQTNSMQITPRTLPWFLIELPLVKSKTRLNFLCSR